MSHETIGHVLLALFIFALLALYNFGPDRNPNAHLVTATAHHSDDRDMESE